MIRPLKGNEIEILGIGFKLLIKGFFDGYFKGLNQVFGDVRK